MSVLELKTPGQLAKECEPINRFEEELAQRPAAPHQPVFQKLTKGLYMRTILMSPAPDGTPLELTSRIHNVEHQYVVWGGEFEMWSEETGLIHVDCTRIPRFGVTRPGTRRAFRILKPTMWSIFVPTDCTDLDSVIGEIMEPQEFPVQGAAQ